MKATIVQYTGNQASVLALHLSHACRNGITSPTHYPHSHLPPDTQARPQETQWPPLLRPSQQPSDMRRSCRYICGHFCAWDRWSCPRVWLWGWWDVGSGTPSRRRRELARAWWRCLCLGGCGGVWGWVGDWLLEGEGERRKIGVSSVSMLVVISIYNRRPNLLSTKKVGYSKPLATIYKL